MSDAEHGQVSTDAAQVYDSLFVPALFGAFAESTADAASVAASDDVVDVACGSGALTRVLRGRTTGRVVGVDINAGMLLVAGRHGGEIEYIEGDAQNLAFADEEFAVATCQFGLMFLEDPSAAVAELARVARRGVVAVWDALDESEGYSAMRDLFEDDLGTDAASSLDPPFALGKPGVLEAIFEAAGVDAVSYRSIQGTGRFESIDQWITTEVRGWTLGDSIDDDRLAALIETARSRFARFATPEGCSFGIKARIATWVSP